MSKANSSVDILAESRLVLDIEIEALQSVRSKLAESFISAVEAIFASTGQVCVTGVGKSGIVGNKIAATLRSTGTPAVFLNAGEALHGDIGMIRKEDIVLAVGKSGESAELNTLLRYLKKEGIRIISITSNNDSSMAQLSDIVIALDIPREACPLNLAPTASTTATMVVGDAIAVALMKLKNISSEDFARHHPGGQLGRRLRLSVSDVMRKDDQNPVIHENASMKEMLVRLTAFHVGAISVVNDQGQFLGLITDYDVRKSLEDGTDFLSLQPAQIMNAHPFSASPEMRAVDALNMMRQREKPIAVLPVIDGARTVVGMVHLHDLISAGL